MCVKSIETGQIPAIANFDWSWSLSGQSEWGLEEKDPWMHGLNFVMDQAKADVRNVIKNSVCIGGMNLSAVFKKID